MPVTFNAVKGVQRNTQFFQTNMSFGEIEKIVILPEEMLGDDLFNEETSLQRKLNWTRVRNEMVPYLGRPDSFFSSITLFMIPRNYEALEEGDGFDFKPYFDRGENIGQLEVDQAIQFFPADGQHRVGAIRERLKIDPNLANVHVPVILIPFQSRGQVRQYFSDLNRTAKNVNKSIGLSFETRDPVAVIVKDLERRIPLFKKAVNHFSTSLSQKSPNVITINTAHECTKMIIKGLQINTEDLWDVPNDDTRFKSVEHEVAGAWTTVIEAMPAWDEIENETMTAGQVREEYVHAHAVGWQSVFLAASCMMEVFGQEGWQAKFNAAARSINWERSNPDWQGVCMIGERMNNTSGFVRATAGYILSKADVVSGPAETLITHYETTKRKFLETT